MAQSQLSEKEGGDWVVIVWSCESAFHAEWSRSGNGPTINGPKVNGPLELMSPSDGDSPALYTLGVISLKSMNNIRIRVTPRLEWGTRYQGTKYALLYVYFPPNHRALGMLSNLVVKALSLISRSFENKFLKQSFLFSNNLCSFEEHDERLL